MKIQQCHTGNSHHMGSKKQSGGIAFPSPAQFEKMPGQDEGAGITDSLLKYTGAADVPRFPVQRNTGNRTIVQRYQENDMEGAIDATTYEERARIFGLGLNGFSQSNRGWVSVTTAAGAVHRIERESAPAGHTEELLLAEVEHRFGAILMNDPNDNTLTRITEIYTERRPCGAGGEYPGVNRSQRNDGSCHIMLGQHIHDNIRVSYSAANNDAGHGALMGNEYRAYVNEVVNDTKRITAGHMRTRAAGDRVNLIIAIRTRNFAVNGDYGRDYLGDLTALNDARNAVALAHAQLANAVANMGDNLPPAMALGPMLQDLDAQFAGAHAAGSAGVLANIAARRQAWLDVIANFGELYFGFDDTSFDKKNQDPKPPPPSGASGGGGSKVEPMLIANDPQQIPV